MCMSTNHTHSPIKANARRWPQGRRGVKGLVLGCTKRGRGWSGDRGRGMENHRRSLFGSTNGAFTNNS